MLEAIADDVWEAQYDFKIGRIVPLGHRMTVLRLATGALAVHSPVPLEEGLADALADLGEVRHVLAPSQFHNLYLGPWGDRYADATFWVVPGFRERYPKLRVDAILDEQSDLAGLTCIPIEGMPKIRECVVLHEASRSLVVADLVFHFPRSDSFTLRLLLKTVGAYGRVAASRLFRSFIKDRSAMRASLDRVLALDFDRLIVGHGVNVETGAKRALEEAYAWLRA